MSDTEFPAADDPDCKHRSHYECVACRKIVCARCGAEMAEASDCWKTIGYWCPSCIRRTEEES
jgi:hypothetical protein